MFAFFLHFFAKKFANLKYFLYICSLKREIPCFGVFVLQKTNIFNHDMTRHEQLMAALQHNFGFDTFKGNQEAIINNVMDGNNTFVLMPTGGGKSLCYQLPALMMEGVAIIISPLIALMKNQVDAMRSYYDEDSIAHFINSSLSRPEIHAVHEDIINGKTKLLYMAPEGLQKPENVDLLQGIKVSFYAIDEAHCISEWGHDFRPEYRNIRPLIEKIGTAPIIALTATATPKVQQDIQKNLQINDATIFKSSFNRPNLYYEVRPKTAEVNKDLVRFIKQMEGKSGIVYCMARKEVEALAQILQVNNISALPYHAGMDSAERNKHQDAFLMEKCQVIVATIAFGMGIDKPDVRFVIHYDVPKSLEGYYQETGRAGRDGGEGRCICFYSPKDIERLRSFQNDRSLQNNNMQEVEITNQLLAETQQYMESVTCRRRILLHYFGEMYPNEKCGCCDNCNKIFRQYDATELLGLIIETVQDCNERFKPEHIVDILHGNKTADVLTFHHEELENFGVASDEEEDLLSTIMKEGLIHGYLEKDMTTYGSVHITPAGKKFLRKPTKFEIPIEMVDEEAEENIEQNMIGSSAADMELFSILKDLRKKVGKMHDVPPYVIFQDPSLEAMATFYPITQEELQNIPGVGAGKAKRYGAEFLKVIKEYVEENEIIRPEDLRVKTVAHKSAHKVAIIEAIDRRVAIDDLALRFGMSMEEIVKEIEAIVYSGTKLNIRYFLEEVIEPDTIEEIFDYFKHAENDSIKLAMQELGEDYYKEIEVRLVRIQFHSDLGN